MSIAPAQSNLIVTPESPWLGLRSFTEDAQAFFFGRTEELNDLYERILDKPLTILFGQSGLGKSSLLQAALIPRLRSAALFPILIRFDHDPTAPPLERQLLDRLRAALEAAGLSSQVATIAKQLDDPSPSLDHAAFLWMIFHDPSLGFIPKRGAKPDGFPRPAFLIDQFEEIFTLGDRPARRPLSLNFRETLAALVENRVPQSLRTVLETDDDLAERLDYKLQATRVLLSLREDFLHLLERWRRSIPSLMENRLELRMLNGPKALEAVVRPGQLRPTKPAIIPEEVGSAIVRFVAGATAEMPLEEIDAVPPLLSLVCAELNAQRLVSGAEQLTQAQFEGHSTDILSSFYLRSFDRDTYGGALDRLAGAPEALTAARTLIEDRLLSADGFRESIAFDTIARDLSHAADHDMAKAILDALVERRLLTLDERGGVRRIELAHDVLAPIVRTSRDERHEANALAKAKADQAQAEAETNRVVQERNRLRRLALLAGCLALAAAVSAFFGWSQLKRSRAAFDQAAKAIAKEKDAEASEGRARAQTEELQKEIIDGDRKKLTVGLLEADPRKWAMMQNNLGIALRNSRAGDKGDNLRMAIAAYEAALTVYTKEADPRNWAMTQNNLGNAWGDMLTGDKGENLRKAIAAYKAALTVYTKEANPNDWAMAQYNLGITWDNMPTDAKGGENLHNAIAAYEAALTVYTRNADPSDWAATQYNLGNAWSDMPTDDKGEHLRNAITAYEAALTVYTRNADPSDWAATQNNLGNAWRNLPPGDNEANLRKAIAAYEATLTVRTKEANPSGWAMTQNNLGIAWRHMPAGNKEANLRNAIAAYEAALTVYTKDVYPSDWAMTQNNLGVAWDDMPTGDKGENLRKAIDAYKAALTVRTKEADPSDWAMTQNNLGIAWYDMPTGDKGENLRKAIAAYKAALTVYTKEANRSDWAAAQNNIGNAWGDMPTDDKGENLRNAIAAYEAALTGYTEQADPSNWAATQNSLGNAWYNMPTGDKGGNLRNAIAAYEAALTVYTKETDPSNWAMAQNNLGNAWDEMPTGDKGEDLHKAIAAYEAARTVRTKEANPGKWAAIQNNLGNAWQEMPSGDKGENLRNAIAAYEAALTVYSRNADPSEWAMTQNNLGIAWRNMPTGDKEENLRKAIAAYEAALTVRTKEADPIRWAGTLTNLSWSQILLKDFAQALVTTEKAKDLMPPNLYLETNRAHALLFLGRTDEAKAIYLEHIGEKLDDKPWEEVIKDDFDALEKQGITSPQFQTVRELLKSAK